MQTSNFKCGICKHFWTNNKDGIFGGCRAFPDGIPDEAKEGNAHNKPIKGQIGDYTYEEALPDDIPLILRQQS